MPKFRFEDICEMEKNVKNRVASKSTSAETIAYNLLKLLRHVDHLYTLILTRAQERTNICTGLMNIQIYPTYIQNHTHMLIKTA